MTVKQPSNCKLTQLLKIKQELFNHKYVTAQTDTERQFYKGKVDELALAITYAQQHNKGDL